VSYRSVRLRARSSSCGRARSFPLALTLAAFLLAVPAGATAQDQPPELLLAIDAGDIGKIQELLDAGADPNLAFRDRTPLMFAIWSDRSDIFHLLLEKGADLKTGTEEMGPLITIAAGMGNTEVLGTLLDRGVDIDARAKDGRTALMIAVHNHHSDAVAFLIERGADVNAQEGSGWTALMLAAMNGDLACVNHLIEGGADVNLETNDRESPLDRARLLERTEVVEALLAAGAKEGGLC